MPRDKTEAHEKIIAAAVREFMTYGFENASMRRIAAEVGLTVGALYRHFPNKEEMFAALVEPTIDELMAKYQAFVEQGYEVMKCGDVQQLWNESESETKLLMRFIYDVVKASKPFAPEAESWGCLLDGLRQRGADYFILACTELPILANALGDPGPFLDPTKELAREAILFCGYPLKEE